MTTKLSIYILTLGILLPSNVYAHWQRTITNYTRHDYMSGSQNWMISQHANGWIYFANNKGLLEYDGTEWNTYPIHNSKTRAVKAGNEGRIYIGGMNQFGYFVPDRLGGLSYICLSDSLGWNADVGIIWDIHITDDRVYFQSDWDIFYLDNDHLQRIRTHASVSSSAIINNRFYFVTSEGGMTLNGDEPSFMYNTEFLGTVKVVSILPYQDDILFVTSREGIYRYDGRSLQPFYSAADPFIVANQMFSASINGTLLALGSVQDGVLLLNTETNTTEKISITNGLQNRTILGLEFDKANNLWLGLDNGIDCVHLNSPLFSLYGNKTLIGSGYASAFYNNKLYLGTNQGLYVADPELHPDPESSISFISGTEGQVWSLYSYKDELFCLSDNGVFVIDKSNRLEHLRMPLGIWSVVPLPHHPDVLIAGSYSGLFVIRKTGNGWVVQDRLNEFYYSCKTLFMEENNVLWVANKEKGIYRLTLKEDLTGYEKIKEYEIEGITRTYDVDINRVDGFITVVTPEGLYRYNSLKDTFEPWVELEEQLGSSAAYTHIYQHSNRDIWYVVDGYLRIARYNPASEKYVFQENEFYLKGSMNENFEHIHIWDNKQAIIGTEEGFSLLQYNNQQAHQVPLNLQIRKVYITGGKDSLAYGRSILYDKDPVVFPYRENSIRIRYSANNYDRSQATFYSYRLNSGNKEEPWTLFTEYNAKEYTDLREGNYTFEVKLITDHNKEPVVTSFAFTVLPPWYRSWWAYLLYVIGVGMAILIIIDRFNRSKQKLIRQKNEEISRQEQEFLKEREMKDKTIDSLREETLQVELRHKTDELIQSTLNIVRKNEILQEIKKDAQSIMSSIKDENMVNIRRKTLRLIGHIDTNIEHDNDFRAFQNSFDQVHRDFFRLLEEKYPELNHKDKMLCCYIRMNLMSKEIAPLLNISVRGVEISRYRLRKKLRLNEKDNLAEYLQAMNRQ